MKKHRMITEHKAVANYKERVATIAALVLPQITAQNPHSSSEEILGIAVKTARRLVNIADEQCDAELAETPGKAGL